jgi:rRNA processing protein Krr1/Pno1
MFGRLLQTGEKESLKMAKRFRRRQQRLIGDIGNTPEIAVKDLNNNYTPG